MAGGQGRGRNRRNAAVGGGVAGVSVSPHDGNVGLPLRAASEAARIACGASPVGGVAVSWPVRGGGNMGPPLHGWAVGVRLRRGRESAGMEVTSWKLATAGRRSHSRGYGLQRGPFACGILLRLPARQRICWNGRHQLKAGDSESQREHACCRLPECKGCIVQEARAHCHARLRCLPCWERGQPFRGYMVRSSDLTYT